MLKLLFWAFMIYGIINLTGFLIFFLNFKKTQTQATLFFFVLKESRIQVERCSNGMRLYKIQNGDNFVSISNKNEAMIRELKYLYPKLDDRFLIPGQNICIPRL